jgi:hypothetical protein
MVAEIISDAIGRPVRAESVSREAQRDALSAAGLGERQVEGIAGMSSVTSGHFVAEDKRSTITTTPTTLDAWAYATLRPALLAPQG